MRSRLEDLNRRGYAVVMFHHSLEHLGDPAAALAAARALLRDSGRILGRIPLADTYPWRKYGVHWVALDAPRHLFLYSEAVFKAAASASGLAVERVFYDSHELQFWGSEVYLKGKPLSVGPDCSVEQMSKYRLMSEELNHVGDGDSACFVLRTA